MPLRCAVLKSPWLRAVGALFLVAVLWYFARNVANQWSSIADVWSDLHVRWGMMALSGGVVFLSYAVLIETWRRTVSAWGGELRFGAAARIWFISNLGKYVPGKVWQIGAMGVLAQQEGVTATAAVGSSLVVNLVNIVAGCLVIAVSGGAGVAPSSLIPLTIVAAIVAAATPWVLPVLFRAASRISGRELVAPRIPPSAVLIALAGCAIAWVLYGIAYEFLAIALFGSTAGTTASYIAVFTLSYLIGYLVLFAPGGVGVRETSLTAAMAAAHMEAGADGFILVIISRLWLTVLEATPGLLLLTLRRFRPTPTIPHGSHSDRTDHLDIV